MDFKYILRRRGAKPPADTSVASMAVAARTRRFHRTIPGYAPTPLVALPELARELGVADRVEFLHADASGYVAEGTYDVAACIGATWIGGGVAGTIGLLARSLRPGGLLLIGEPYWLRLPPTEEAVRECRAGAVADFLLLPELLASFGALGYDVVEMVLADREGWDRYEAAKWLTMRRWLDANPDDDFAGEIRAELTSAPVRYAAYAREYLGWGVFALMAR